MLNGVFEVRLYQPEHSVPNLLKTCSPNLDGSSRHIVEGEKHAVDLSKLRRQIAQIDYDKVRKRRRQFVRLFYEAKLIDEPGRGISFTNMLLLLSHYTLINDEDALQVDELLVRRARMERVDDLVNLDRVRGLLRTIYWRGKFQDWRAEKARAAAAGAGLAVPAIVLEPEAASPTSSVSTTYAPRAPSLADEPLQPTRSPWGTPTHTPPASRPTTPTSPRRMGSLPTSPRRQGTGSSESSVGRWAPSRQGTGSSSSDPRSRQGTLELDPFDNLSADSHFTLGSSVSHGTVVVNSPTAAGAIGGAGWAGGAGGVGGAGWAGAGAPPAPPSHLSHVSTLGPSRRGSADSWAYSQRLSNYSAHSASAGHSR